MIGGSAFAEVFGFVPTGGEEFTSHVAVSAVRAGFGIVLNHPGTKKPVCPLTAVARKRADKEAGGRHVCGIPGHTFTDATKVKAAIARLGAVNIGVNPYASRMLVVDVDDPTQLVAFLDYWSAATGQDEHHRTLTVQSPGAQDAAGNWVHHDGGHFWFTLPDGVDVPPAPEKYAAPGGWVAYWGPGVQALVPPSVRPEGAYRLLGTTEDCPDFVLKLIMEQPVRTGPDRSVGIDEDDPIERWNAEHPWSELLKPYGWTEYGTDASCGCPTWTAPGSHDNGKSATAHGPGCRKRDVTTGWGPLHIWSDNPPEELQDKKGWTPLQFFAAMEHQGNASAAMSAEGIQRKQDIPDVYDIGSDPEVRTEAPTDAAAARIVDLTGFLDGTYQPPTPGVGAARSDGIRLLYASKWHSVVALTTAGKTWFALWHTAELLTAGETVVYLHFEETSPAGTVDRLRKLGVPIEAIRRHFVWLDCSIRWTHGLFADVLAKTGPPALVVLDGINAACSQHGWPVDKPEAIGAYRSMFVRPGTATGAAVLSLGHPPKARDRQGERHGFGSTAWLDEVDGVGFRMEASTRSPIRKGHRGSSRVYSAKDRYGGVEQHGQLETERESGWYLLGRFELDDDPVLDQFTAYLHAPKLTESGAVPDAVSLLCDAVIGVFGNTPKFDSKTQLRDRLRALKIVFTNEDLGPALDRLEAQGKILREVYRGGHSIALVPYQDPDRLS